MRIALVSAFAFPHFVGGGTVQVHQLALALRRLGVDVHIFSGARRPASRAFELRHETFQGLPITSINTEPFLAFDDPRNYDNARADLAVLGWLDAVRPDIIHAHSLQGIGAGWFDRAASERPVVVTMHDWWWICARQFLVTAQLEVDGPLVDGAACECAGGVDFNRNRRVWLADQLAHADRILVPSTALRDSMLTNGYRGERIEVDPNGVLLTRRPRRGAGAATRVPRLGFVGGWHEFKGLPTLLAARRKLANDPLPFHLICWGATDSPEARDPPPGVTVLPAYLPEDTSAVMAGLDALAVPSLMRESFSLVTAEALASGVPVICSDNGGAELLVRHGINGLVVESGSIPAWTQTLTRWGSDAALRHRLRLGAAIPPLLVDPDTQAAHLRDVYEELSARRSGGSVVLGPRPAEPGLLEARPSGAGAKRGGKAALQPLPGLLLVSGIEGAPLRYRGHHLVQAHRAIGGTAACLHYRDARVLETIPAGGLVVFYRVPWSSWVRQCLEAALGAGATPVFSIDDLVFDPSMRDLIPALRSLAGGEAELWMEGVERYRQTADACGVFIGSTPTLVSAAERQGWRAHLWANHLGAETALLSQVALRESQEARASRDSSGKCRIGYLSGTTSHDDDWAVAEGAIAAVLQRRPGSELWLAGHLRTGSALTAAESMVRRLAFRPFQEMPRLHAELDIVVAPLETGLAFSEAKSAVKWIEAAALGIPVVASPTGPFREIIEDGVTGILAEPGGWEAALDSLAGDPELRRRIGLAARRSVYRDHGPWSGAQAWSRLVPQLRREERSLPAAGPVEHPTAWALEPEAPTGYLDRAPVTAATLTSALGGEASIEVGVDARYPRVRRIDLQTTGVRPGSPSLRFELRGPLGRLAAGEVAADLVSDGGWTAWEPGAADTPSDVRLTVVVSQPGAAPGRGVRIWRDEVEICSRVWAAPNRNEICAVATGRQPMSRSRQPRRAGARKLRTLWFKGRASLYTAGLRPTAFKVLRLVQRELRGALRRRQSRSRNRL